MRHLIASIAFAGLLPFTAVSADIADDLAAQLPAATVLSNALQGCIAVKTNAIANTEDQSCTSTCTYTEIERLMQAVADVDVELLGSFVTAGIDSCLSPGDVARAAINAGADPADVTQAAILAGADPTEVSEATAAGGAPQGGQGLAVTPGRTGNAITPPPFGSNAGGGGGGNTSPI